MISLLLLLSLSFVSASDYSDSFTKSNRDILRKWNLVDKTLVMDKGKGEDEDISWRQASKCGWSKCTETYRQVDYYQDGNKKLPLLKVFVAKKHGDPPLTFNTHGYSKGEHKLHFGNVFIEQTDGASALFFVIHPNSWGPYQHRFVTSSLTAFAKDILSKGASKAADAAAGAVIGSVVPSEGTAMGGVLGAIMTNAAGSATEDYMGDYLRYIGDRHAGHL